MKILFQSDLHLDYNKKTVDSVEERYLEFISCQNFDILIIVGDISSNTNHTLRILNRLRDELGKIVYFVPGNHDIQSKKNSLSKIEKLKENPSVLFNSFVNLNDEYTLFGGFSWYDYSFKPEFANDNLVKYHKENFWSDSWNVQLLEDDISFSKKMLREIHSEIKKINKKIIFVNHFLPSDIFLTESSDENWLLNNSFFGCSSLTDIVNSNPNIEYVAFGHTHKRFGMHYINDVGFICNPLGYYMEWKTDDFERELKNSSYMLEI